MGNTYTAVFDPDREPVISCCPDIRGIKGQRQTKEQARESLAAPIPLILEDRGTEFRPRPQQGNIALYI